MFNIPPMKFLIHLQFIVDTLDAPSAKFEAGYRISNKQLPSEIRSETELKLKFFRTHESVPKSAAFVINVTYHGLKTVHSSTVSSFRN